MITCPGCQKTLPDWAKQCQFCGSDTTKVARPVAQVKERRPMSTDAAPWVFGVYYAISGYYLLSGLFDVLIGVGVVGPEQMRGSIAHLVFGGLRMVLGLGLITRWEPVRGIVNVACFLTMIGAGLNAFQGFFLLPLLGAFMAIALVLDVIDFATAGFMIFLIGETDKRAPNI